MNRTERYWQKVQALKAQLASFGRPALRIVPKGPHRPSGPTPSLPTGWHLESGQAHLPVLGPKCRMCDQRIIQGGGLLSALDHICAPCLSAIPSGQRAPQVEDDGPQHAA